MLFRFCCDIFATLKPEKTMLMYARTKDLFKSYLCMLLIVIYTLCQSLWNDLPLSFEGNFFTLFFVFCHFYSYRIRHIKTRRKPRFKQKWLCTYILNEKNKILTWENFFDKKTKDVVSYIRAMCIVETVNQNLRLA